MNSEWQTLGEAVLTAPDDDARAQMIEDFLLPRWQSARSQAAMPGLLRLQDWAQSLALRAASTVAGRSLRQAERRIKGWTGLPMRELRGLGRAEQAFFHAISQGETPARWTDVAADVGYADQSHLCRETRRMTGFSPAELRWRIAGDESFWIYQIWTEPASDPSTGRGPSVALFKACEREPGAFAVSQSAGVSAPTA